MAKNNNKKYSFSLLKLTKYTHICIGLLIAVFVCSGLILVYVNDDQAAWVQNIIALATLVFAMFIGYFAFDEFRKVKRNEYKDEAAKYLKTLDLKNALRSYENAYEFGEREWNTLVNLSELYSISRETRKARKLVNEARQIAKTDGEKLACEYLEILSYLVDNDNEKLKINIKNLLKIVENKTLMKSQWDFNQVEKETVSGMNSRAKKIYKYIKNLMIGKFDCMTFASKIKAISWLDG